jgi:hypothetical protein
MKNSLPMNSLFANLIPTDTPENIYYADLFRIENRNWMIQGFGKSDAASIASYKDPDAMYATDAVAIIRDGDTLWGRYDPGAHSIVETEQSRKHKLDAIAYCLDEEQTIKAYAPRGGQREIVDAGATMLLALCARYPYPALLTPQFFTQQELEYLENPVRMTERFIELTKDIVSTKFLLVPYMPTVAEKAALYRSFVF